MSIRRRIYRDEKVYTMATIEEGMRWSVTWAYRSRPELRVPIGEYETALEAYAAIKASLAIPEDDESVK